MENLRRSTAKVQCINATIFSFDSVYIRLLCVKLKGEGGRFNHCKTLNSVRTGRTMFMSFCIINTSRLLILQILIQRCKVFYLFLKIFPCKKFISKIALHCKIKFSPHSQPSFSPSLSLSLSLSFFLLFRYNQG